MTQTEPVTGAEFLARSLAANGTTHVFFIDAVLRRTLIELGTLGITRCSAIARRPSPTWPTVTPASPAARAFVLRSRWGRSISRRGCRTRISAGAR